VDKEVMDVSKFWEYLRDGSLLVAVAIVLIALVSLGIVGTWLYFLISGQAVPPDLAEWLRTFLGFWLGVLGATGTIGWATARARAK